MIEGCLLIAHYAGDGWHLAVHDGQGNEVALLEWPKVWPKEVDSKFITACGFNIYPSEEK